MTNAFIVLQTNTLAQGEKNVLCAIAQNALFLLYTLVMNVLVLETNALKAHVQTSAPHNYTCN